LLTLFQMAGINGFPGKSRKGELSIVPNAITMLAPCLHDLPEPNSLLDAVREKNLLPLTNELTLCVLQDVRHRNRHLDLLVNQQSLERFQARSKIVRYMRHFLEERDFIEVR
jgi:lysyl-tRNA synthetase class 2